MKINKKNKKVLCIEDNTMFNSLKEASSNYGICYQSLSNHLRNITKSVNGKTFKYIETTDEDIARDAEEEKKRKELLFNRDTIHVLRDKITYCNAVIQHIIAMNEKICKNIEHISPDLESIFVANERKIEIVRIDLEGFLEDLGRRIGLDYLGDLDKEIEKEKKKQPKGHKIYGNL